MLVSSFNLSQSFNYAPYLFCKKRFKTEINCFRIRAHIVSVCGKSDWICSLLNACEIERINSVRYEVEENGRCLPRVLFKFWELSPMYFNFEFTSNCEQYSTENCKCIPYFLCTRLGTVEGRDSLSLSVAQAEFISQPKLKQGNRGSSLGYSVHPTVYLAFFISGMYAPERQHEEWRPLDQCPCVSFVISWNWQ